MSIRINELAERIRSRDYDRYLCSLFAPRRHRPALWVVFAFHIELHRALRVTKEPTIAMIRLKWWQEVIASIYEGASLREHELVVPLKDLITRFQLPRAAFDDLIDAKAMELEYRNGFDTLVRFEEYLDKGAGSLHVLCAMILGVTPESEPLLVIRESAQIYGMVGLVRAIPRDVAEDWICFPHEVMQECGVTPQAVQQGLEAEAMKTFVMYWLSLAKSMHESLKPALRRMPSMHRKMHRTAMLYAEELMRRDAELDAMPMRLYSVPLRLWLGV